MTITGINEQNRDAFIHMAPRYLWEPDTDTYFSIGALWEREDTDLPVADAAGCLIFRIGYEFHQGKLVQMSVLEWLFVEESYRGLGIAVALLDEWKRISVRSGVGDICCYAREDQEELRLCLERNGFQTQGHELEICRMPLAQISESLSSRRPAGFPVCSLREVKEPVFKKAMELFRRTNSVFRTEFAPVPAMDAYDQELSCATVVGGQIRTLLLVRRKSDLQLRVEVFRSLVKDAQKELFCLLQTMVSRAAEKYSIEAWLEFFCADDRLKMVAACLSPDYESYKEYRAWWSVSNLSSFTQGSTLTYRVQDWRASQLAQMPQPTIVEEKNITSLALFDERKAARWTRQGTGIRTFFTHVEQCRENGSLIPELSLVYEEQDIAKAMLLVTGNESDGSDLIVADWYICNEEAQTQLCHLLQTLFTVVAEPPYFQSDTLTFVFAYPEQKQVIESLMEGVTDRDSLMHMYEHPDLGMISARFQALADRITPLGYAFVLEYPQGGLPSMKMLVPDTQIELEFVYESLWEDGELNGFTLYALSKEPVAGAWQEDDESYIVGEWEEPLDLDAQEVAQRMIGIVQEVAVWANRA